MAPFPELAAISKTLNDESNRVNALLLEFERKLCALNLGVEAWVTDQALTDRRLIETYEKYTGDREGELYRSYDQQLGFGQIGDRWALVVRTVTFERPSVLSDWIVLSEGRPTALLQAARPIRVAALKTLDALVEALTEKAKDMVQSIKAVEQTIEKL